MESIHIYKRNIRTAAYLIMLCAGLILSGACTPANSEESAATLNYEELTLLREQAEEGNATAQTNLGEIYRFGNGVRQNYEQAVRWYRKAAEQNEPLAQIYLGYMYHLGNGVPQNSFQAEYWIRSAAEQNEPWAQNNLGAMYHYGSGVQQSYDIVTEEPLLKMMPMLLLRLERILQ